MRAERGEGRRASLLNPGVNWKNIHILAVDDEPGIREYFEEIARGLGVACDTASGGEEATALVERNGPYDIYFIDWKMSGMNGIELSRWIKEHGAGKSVVTMISATEWSLIETEAKDAGVDKFLPKPLFPSTIADCINECLGAPDSSAAMDARPGESDNFEGYCALMAEDVEINREIVLSLLEPTGVEIVCAENGVEAVQKFSEAPEKYDMIFMDVQMPEMDGYEATRQIRAMDLPWAAEIPIIAMTANVFREDIERCIESGMNEHIGKPLDLEGVLAKLRKYLPLRDSA
jgi:CheY-like chemotaxis protein